MGYALYAWRERVLCKLCLLSHFIFFLIADNSFSRSREYSLVTVPTRTSEAGVQKLREREVNNKLR